VHKIGDYVLPDVIKRDVDKTGASKAINPWNLRDNWKGRMRDLLFIEEAEHMKLIRNFDLERVTFEEVVSYKRGETEYYTDPKEEPMLRLQVNGLAEKRPSVLPGDSIYAWIPETCDYEYEGYVHVTEKNSVIVLFNLDFHRKVWNPQQQFNVRFGMQRFTWRIMHHATENVELDVVWPEWDGTKESTKYDIPFEKISLFDSAIAQNERQLRAIHSALNKRFQKKIIDMYSFVQFALTTGIISSGIVCGLVLSFPFIIYKLVSHPSLSIANSLILWRTSYDYGSLTIPFFQGASTLIFFFVGYTLNRSLYYFAATSSLSVLVFTLIVIFPINNQLIKLEQMATMGKEVKEDQAKALIAKWNRLHLVRIMMSTLCFVISVSTSLNLI